VTPDGPAAKAGITAASSPTGAGGDTIVAIDGNAVQSPDDVAGEVAKHEIGDELKVTVRRNGSETTLTVRLERRPDSAP
jgi:putative serine protease PepD